ncbi:MAG: ABC transporter ATP-binding protein [Bryobacteraceae bacterium]
MSGPALRAEKLTKSYLSGDSELVVFSELDLEVKRGERLALVGESGAGKSTLLYLLSGLDRPTSGRIFIDSKDLSAMAPDEVSEFRNQKMGFVWQSHNLLPEFSATENVSMPLRIRGLPDDEAEQKAAQVLAEVGLAARGHHRAGELSGGEQQRVALARALCGDPPILLADELTGNLDPATGERVFELLTRLQAARRLTTVLVTHNLEFARRCDRILRLDAGKLIPAPTGG